jgi:hypothetical protein
VSGSAEEVEFVPGQIIVRFRPGAARSEIAQANRAKHQREMRLERMEVLDVPVGEERAIAESMAKNPNVEFAEPDWITKVGPCEVSTACEMPDGQFFSYKWDLHNTGMVLTQASGKADADIDWTETFDHLGGNAFAGSAVIGILDTGIRPTHQQFAGKILGGRRFLNDGVVVTNYTDDQGHGSHVAGIAAAVGTSAVPGVAYGKNIKLLVGKVCNSAGSCPSSATADGIVWMADNGANVINMSLGSFGGNPDGTGLGRRRPHSVRRGQERALRLRHRQRRRQADNGLPGRRRLSGALRRVHGGGRDELERRQGELLELRPADRDLRAGRRRQRAGHRQQPDPRSFPHRRRLVLVQGGTSMATPQVAGLAALLYATGTTDAAAIRQRLKETADDLEAPGWDNRTGAGRINAYRAITGQNPMRRRSPSR